MLDHFFALVAFLVSATGLPEDIVLALAVALIGGGTLIFPFLLRNRLTRGKWVPRKAQAPQ